MDPKNDIFATIEGKRDFVIALIVIAIFAVFIYQFLFKTDGTDDIGTASSTDQVVSDPMINEDQDAHYLYTNSNTYAATTIQTEAPYDVDIETAVVISDIKKSTSISAESISKPIDTATETIPLSKTVKQATDSIRTAAQNEADNVIPIAIEDKEEVQKAVVTTNIVINCVVVVGVFKEENNKKAVIEKLKSLGHAYAEGILRENLSYVGVPVTCDNEQDRQKLLSQLNQEFGIDSWVMRLKVQ